MQQQNKRSKYLVFELVFQVNLNYQNHPLIKEIKSIGSSYKAGLIAEGKADICIKLDPYTKEWDTAPSEIIIKEAKGVMSDKFGNHMLYNKAVTKERSAENGNKENGGKGCRRA